VTGTLADLPRSRAELLAENALLRQQLIVIRRRTKTPRLTWRERLSLHAFVIVHHESRRVVHFGVTGHPTDEWITQQVRDARPFEEKPKYLICDNDKRYGPLFERVAKASGTEVFHTLYEAPRANAICERFVGSLGRECLDHTLVIGGLHPIRILKGYVIYIDQARPQTCTPRHLRPGQVCAPVQVSGDRATHSGAKGVTGQSAAARKGDCVPGAERAAPRLPLGARLGRCWPINGRMKGVASTPAIVIHSRPKPKLLLLPTRSSRQLTLPTSSTPRPVRALLVRSAA
jgi:hypothetical protein